MISRKTIRRTVLTLCSLLAVLLAVLFLITPGLLNSEAFRSKLQSLVRQETGGQIDYAQIKLVYLPRLALQVDQLKFDLPDLLTSQSERLQVSPDFSRLVFGTFAIDSLLLSHPKVHLTLPTAKDSPSQKTFKPGEIRGILAPLLQPLSAYAPDLELELIGADLALAKENAPLVTATGLDTILSVAADPQAFHIDCRGRSPELVLNLNGTPLSVNISAADLTFTVNQQRLLLELKSLQLLDPAFDFSGELMLAQEEPSLRLNLKSTIPDLSAIRSKILPLQEQIPGSDIILESVLAGTLSDILIQTKGSTLKELLDLDNLKLSARLEQGEFVLPRLAQHATSVRGDLNLADRRLELHNAQFEAGQSHVTITKGAIYRAGQTQPLQLDIGETRLHLDLAELHDNLSRLAILRDPLKEVSTITGQLDFNLQALTGPMAEMQNWDFRASGTIVDTVVRTDRFPAPITFQHGLYNLTDRGFTFEALRIQGLDADLSLSGEVKGKIPVPTQISATVSGEAGETFSHWLRSTSGLPEAYALNTPLKISRGTATWKTGNVLTAQWDVQVASGPMITGDIAVTPPQQLQISVSLTDILSKAHASFSFNEKNLKAGFTGHLQQETIDHIFVAERRAEGRLEGDFSLELQRGDGIGLSTDGNLQGSSLVLPIGISEPLEVSAFALSGQGKALIIQQMSLGFGTAHAEMAGSIASSEGHYQLDLDLHSGPLDLLEMQQNITAVQESLATTKEQQAVDQPLLFNGRVNLDIDALTLRHLSISPLRADIQFMPQEITARLTESTLCGLDLPVSVHVVPGRIDLTLPINARDQDMVATTLCLTGENSKVTGRYDLTGEFQASAPPGGLLDAANGAATFVARNGTIEQSSFVNRLLSVVNLTEFFREDYLTLDKSKLGYERFDVEMKLDGSRMALPKIHFNGTTLEVIGQGEIDLRPLQMQIDLLIAPLKTVDSVIKWLPGVNYLLAGNLVTIPVRVSGPAANPGIKMIPAASVGKGVLGIAERVLKLPIKLVEPLTGSSLEEQDKKVDQPESE